MSKNIRIRTEPNGGDKFLKVQLTQDFDYLEILSLKISQEDVYRSFYSNYGMVVGRVIMNSGVGVPNARISVFIPLTDEDAQNDKIRSIYPYQNLQDLNSDGIRYNTLPNDAQGDCHVPIGTFPTKRELIDNEPLLEVFEKYYKYTTTTNGAGDFLLFGVPVGNHMINVDVDLSDIGIYSQRPYDFIEQGNSKKLFESPTKFKGGTNLNNLTQVKTRQVGVNVMPFWGENNSNEVGITRIDVDLNYDISPKAIFIGSIFGDTEKNSVNKNCRPRRKLGKVCEMNEGEGTIQMLRKTIFGDNERYDVEGGRVITDKGTWAYQIPMNLDYMVTDEYGNLSPTDDPTKGIPTRARVRFKINLDQTGGEGRLRTRASYLIPHNPEKASEIDYSFDESTTNLHFRDFYWNKIYTVKNHIARFQKSGGENSRNFIGFKDVDDCVGVKNPLPFNKIDTDFNIVYSILCLIMMIVLTIINIVNNIYSVKFLGMRLCGLVKLKCISIVCDGDRYTPGCSSGCRGSYNNDFSAARRCFQLLLALAFNVFEFDFYNDWLNGSLYSFLLKYKKVRNKDAKFCGDGNGDGNNFILNPKEPFSELSERMNLNEGVVASYEGELYYKPLSSNSDLKLYSTDIFNLGAVFDCDWQQKPKIQPDLISSTYQMPPLTENKEDDENITTIDPLLFKINCTKVDSTPTQILNIKRICEIGVGLDEGDNQDNRINDADIENEYIRKSLIKLNNENYKNYGINEINSGFYDGEYLGYREKKTMGGLTQYRGNSFYFYFGTLPENTSLDLMNSKFFTKCEKFIKNNLIINGIITNISVLNGNNGSIVLTISGGVPEYTFKWTDNNGNLLPDWDGQNVYNLTEGTYHVEVTDSVGSKSKRTFIINGLQKLDANITTVNARQLSVANGEIRINYIVGGIGPYDVTVTGVSNLNFENVPYSLNIKNLSVGNYNILITDKNIPTDTYSETVSVNIPTTLTIENFVSVNTNCKDFEDGIIMFNIIGGTPEYEVRLTDATNNSYSYNITEGNKYTFNDLIPSTYKLHIEDLYGQIYERTNIVITEPNEMVLTNLGPSILGFTTTLRCTNILVGVSYYVEDYDGNVVHTFTGNGTVTFSVVGHNVSGYQVFSQYGCSSNIL